MTEHLTECIYAPEEFDFEQNIVWGGKPCICDRLRACEQRVLAEREADGPWFRSVVHKCCEDKQTAYAAGLNAAREAVAALDVPSGWVGSTRQGLNNALAAIDALREGDQP